MCKECDLLDYQQEIANEIFRCAHTGDRGECRRQVEFIMRKHIYEQLIDACECAWECTCRAVELADLIKPKDE